MAQQRLTLLPSQAYACIAALAVLAASNAYADYSAANTLDLQLATLTRSQALGVSASQQVGYGTQPALNGLSHALLWTSAPSPLDLNPTDYDTSRILATDGLRHVGSGSSFTLTNNRTQALLWTGTTGTFTNLNPIGYVASYASALAGNQQVGAATDMPGPIQNFQAMLWTGTAASAVVLHPTGFTQSVATGTNGVQQVGYGGGPSTSGREHALLWSGTAASVVDLNPAGFLYSYAHAVHGNQQVGYGGGTVTQDSDHALLWTGSAASFVDLNPAGFTASYANATNGEQQVGYGYHPAFGNEFHALKWMGTAASFVDLHALLPGTPTSSLANAIDPYGNIAGYATYAGNTHAVAWLAGNVFNAGPGATNWNNPANWSSGAPAADNDLLVISSDGLLRTVNFANPNPALGFNKLIIDATHGGTMEVAQLAETLTTASSHIGFIGAGRFTQSGGIHAVTGALTLGARPGATGHYALSGGTLTAGSVHVQNNSQFQQTGGVLTSADVQIRNTAIYTHSAGRFHANALVVADAGRLNLTPGKNKALRVDTVSVTDTAAIDLTDNLLVVSTSGPVDKAGKIAQLSAFIASAKAGGTWTGPGITSSTVPTTPNTTLALADNADLGYATFRGETDIASALFVTQARIGDATLDGKVDAFDLNKLAASWQKAGVVWSSGDFTGDGKVDAFDLNALAANWQFGTGGGLNVSLESALAVFPQLVGVEVPEPTSLALLGLAAPLLLRRRR